MMQQKSQQSPNAIVIGAGPAGSYTALRLATLGIETNVYEEHAKIGLPSHCAGHLSIRSLKKIGYYPLPKGIIENTFDAANFYSPLGTQFSIHLKKPVTCALNRAKFDQYIANQAQQAGAVFHLGHTVQSLQIEHDYVKGVNLKDGTQVSSKITLDAEGISSRLLRQTRLRGITEKSLVYAVEAEIDKVHDVELHSVEVYMGSSAPGFYGWLIPRPDGTAKLGLAVSHGNPQTYLRYLMTKHPVAKRQVKGAKIVQANYHAIPLTGPIDRTYDNGFLAVGDVASQVKPTTGGGVIFSLTCGEIAANVVKSTIELGDVSAKTLSVYQKRCNKTLSFDISFMLRLRQFLNSLSDKRLDSVLRFCNRFGVAEALADVEEIDYQGQMLLHVATKPAVISALGYFGLLYLFANP
ncbi:MAG: NAD(P)/FAD-dependent oxidoreductase [Candidatus Bathyarchaeota archaeon]|uniref:NAD(P)/FAD-dependent oxidoreductase n=1 Tax=Candidatus Bathycorpusculum sp. TaxID=2994959 RepID=UPI002839F9FC|nr:NAD(P)/FAD-dependent oxidoreductase [Candidatus Termiticorpusculum sp.]MCL2257728.1 NAD(P)/FAD-dependent oxidoreductase [Candidatus Termiticorpusculum sp.]MCL2292145.1 NAD(P)/FAD-dependent oxidoreductase [Candidatus Termiticorpusculum sp.]